MVLDGEVEEEEEVEELGRTGKEKKVSRHILPLR